MPRVADPLLRLVCTPAVLAAAPADWRATMLQESEVALLADDGGLDAITALAHELELTTMCLLRPERSPAEQEATVIAFAAARPLVWVADGFGEETTRWAQRRGPMTLLVESAGPLGDDDLRRVERFVVILGRQAE